MNNPYPTTDTTWLEKAVSEDNWREQLEQLIDKHRLPTDSGDLAACKRLAPKLRAVASVKVSWTPNYILGVLHRNKGMSAPSPIFTDAVNAVIRKKRDRSKDRPRVYTSFASQAEADYVMRHLSAEDRRDILLGAASHEDFEEDAQ